MRTDTSIAPWVVGDVDQEQAYVVGLGDQLVGCTYQWSDHMGSRRATLGYDTAPNGLINAMSFLVGINKNNQVILDEPIISQLIYLSLKWCEQIQTNKSLFGNVTHVSIHGKTAQLLAILQNMRANKQKDTLYTMRRYEKKYSMKKEYAIVFMAVILWKHIDWNGQSSDQKRRLKLFDEYLAIYDTYGDNGHGYLHPSTRAIAMQTLDDPTLYTRMCDTAVLVYTHGTYKDEDEVRRSLLFRYPVYYGRPDPTKWNNDVANRVLLHMRTPWMIDATRPHPYALGSIVRCAVNKDMRNVKEIGVLHTWGVDFESIDTDDFKQMISRGDDGRYGFKDLFDRSYGDRVDQTLDNVFQAMIELVNKAGTINTKPIKEIMLRFPSLGLDTHLKAFGENGTNGRDTHMGKLCRSIFIDRLNEKTKEWVDKYNGYVVRVFACDRSNETYEMIIGDKHIAYLDDLLDIQPRDVATGVMTIIVNESNPHSFISNGGMRDPTISGHVVGGAYGKFFCDASLHAYVIASRFTPTPYPRQVHSGGNAHTSLTRAHQNKAMYKALCVHY
jgi:hypothetical protein